MNERKCPICHEIITGRRDKKFCSDQCRNDYFNRLNSDTIKYVRNINNRLRKNRRILAELNPGGTAKVHRDELSSKGFNFKYFTNVYKTKQGKLYYFCYEQGYLLLDNNWVALVIKKEYIK